MQAVSQNGHILRFATEELRGECELVMKAVLHDGDALQHARHELRGNRDFMMKAVSQSGHALEFATDELRADRELVMKAVSQSGYALAFATDKLRADREVVMKAVSECGYALEFASDELRGDQEIMEVALAKARDAVVLSVTLLSGRCCHQIFRRRHVPLNKVLYACGELLGMDPDHVAGAGTLVSGTVAILVAQCSATRDTVAATPLAQQHKFNIRGQQTPYETRPHMKQHCCCAWQGHPRLALSTVVAAENHPTDDVVSCRVCFVSGDVVGEFVDPNVMKDRESLFHVGFVVSCWV